MRNIGNITRKNKKIPYTDHPDFIPNLTPEDMFRMGSFGGNVLETDTFDHYWQGL